MLKKKPVPTPSSSWGTLPWPDAILPLPLDAQLRPLDERRLAQVAAATGSAVIYVIRADGLTVAASNAGEDRSFVGRDYGFRPYFKQALAGGAGSQFALGTVSGRPGLYLARRIGAGTGVVVVKVEFDAVEAAWRAAREVTFVTDARGIVLVTSEPNWRFDTLHAVDAAEEVDRDAVARLAGARDLAEFRALLAHALDHRVDIGLGDLRDRALDDHVLNGL